VNKSEYLNNADVASFVTWMANKLPDIRAKLAVKSSSHVPGGINKEIVGVQDAIDSYKWRASWVDQNGEFVESMDWDTTSSSLQRLGGRLRNAIGAGSSEALEACKQVLRWGGDRNGARGALPFLKKRINLQTYLKDCTRAMSLDAADLGGINNGTDPLRVVGEMNSMLTKVHALASRDGLPIYDSRVAATIATLVEMWRRERGLTSVPEILKFPCLSVVRSPLRFASDAPDPEVLSYDRSLVEPRTKQWVSAKIRLGWLMGGVLQTNEKLFSSEGGIARRMHALEAAFFMLGYDVSCLSESGADERFRKERVSKKIAGNYEHLTRGEEKKGHTLSKKKEFNYFGSIDEGILIRYDAGQNLVIEADQIEEVMQQIQWLGSVKLGASREFVQDDTLAAWLIQSGTRLFNIKITGQHVSHIAAVLVQESEGRLVSETKERATWITYNDEKCAGGRRQKQMH